MKTKVKMICLECKKVVDREFTSPRKVKPIRSYCGNAGKTVVLYPIVKYIKELRRKIHKLGGAL